MQLKLKLKEGEIFRKNLICPYCHDSFTNTRNTVCCICCCALTHKDCWDELGYCACCWSNQCDIQKFLSIKETTWHIKADLILNKVFTIIFNSIFLGIFFWLLKEYPNVWVFIGAK